MKNVGNIKADIRNLSDVELFRQSSLLINYIGLSGFRTSVKIKR